MLPIIHTMFQIDILTVYLVRIDFTVRQINANANMAMFRNQITPITSSNIPPKSMSEIPSEMDLVIFIDLKLCGYRRWDAAGK